MGILIILIRLELFLLQNILAKTVVGELQYVEGLSCPGIQSFDDTVKNCLSIDSDAPFSLQMTEICDIV